MSEMCADKKINCVLDMDTVCSPEIHRLVNHTRSHARFLLSVCIHLIRLQVIRDDLSTIRVAEHQLGLNRGRFM